MLSELFGLWIFLDRIVVVYFSTINRSIVCQVAVYVLPPRFVRYITLLTLQEWYIKIILF